MDALTISIIILILTMTSYVLNKVPMAVTALTSTALLVVLGALDQKTALSYFGNSNVITIIMMFIVAAGFNRTQFVRVTAAKSVDIAKGSLTKIMVGYILVTVLLAQFIQSPLVVFTIMSPLMAATCSAMNISPSKTMFALAIASITPTSAFPFGTGATGFLELNGYLEAGEYTDYVVKMWDPALARFPVVLACILYCVFLAVRMAPDNEVTTGFGGGRKLKEQAPLPPLQEKLGYIIFAATTIALMLQPLIGLPIWLIAMIGALLMILTGVLKEKEAYEAIPWSIVFMFIGSLCISASLSETGAGQVIGEWIAGFVGNLKNQYLISAVFYLIPLVLTQFMNNRGTMLIFIPIAVITCKALGANPIGPMILAQSGCLTSFMTPMATSSIPVMMGAGGYDQKSLIKQGWLPIVIFAVVSILWIPTVFPMFG